MVCLPSALHDSHRWLRAGRAAARVFVFAMTWCVSRQHSSMCARLESCVASRTSGNFLRSWPLPISSNEWTAHHPLPHIRSSRCAQAVNANIVKDEAGAPQPVEKGSRGHGGPQRKRHLKWSCGATFRIAHGRRMAQALSASESQRSEISKPIPPQARVIVGWCALAAAHDIANKW